MRCCLKISDCKHADNFALFLVHLEFQFSLKIPLGGFQKSLCRSLALCQDNNVIRISDDRHAPSCHLLIVFVQVDVGKQWTEWASLRRAFFCLHQQSVFHDPGFQIPLNEFNDPFVVDVLPQKVHQQFVIQSIEVFGQIHKHRLCVALFCILLHLLNCHLCTSARTIAEA